MSMRERTTEVAVLKAIGYSKGLVLGLVLGEAMLVAGLGGVVGCPRQQAPLRRRRHRALHRRLPAVLLRPLGRRA